MPYGSGGDDGECGHMARPYVVELCLGVRTTEPVDEVARLGQDGDRKGELVGLFFQPAAAEFMCRVGPIRQRHNDVGVHQNHDERSATEAVREQLVHPLG
jgi:hypothetical protein